MPLTDYGVWKARPAGYIVESNRDDPYSPHLSLYYHENPAEQPEFDPSLRDNNNNIPGVFRAAINIKSGHIRDSRLAYWVNEHFEEHPIVNTLASQSFGFQRLTEPSGLDYIRLNLFNNSSGRRLFHDIPGPDNDIIEVLKPEIIKAIETQADIYLFGERFSLKDGIHDVHMIQGNARRWENDDGVFQDGGLLIHQKDSTQWMGIFLAFASQAVHTDNQSGHAISSVTWDDFLPGDIIENLVIISRAFVNPPGNGNNPRRSERGEFVTLTNRMNRRVRLESWTIHNSAGNVQILPSSSTLEARGTKTFEVPDCPLSNTGDIITLVNERGLKVDGVSYNRRQGQLEGQQIVFPH